MSSGAQQSEMAISGRSILSFSLEKWTGLWRSRHHIMAHLATQNTVLFATAPYYIRDVFRRRTEEPGGEHGLTRVSDNLYSYVPPRWLPTSFRYPTFDRIIRNQRCRIIRKTLSNLGMKQPVLYIWHPVFADMVGRFDEAFVVYHVYDEYNAFEMGPKEKEVLAAQEKVLLKRADIVFTSAEETCEVRRASNPNIHVVRNGVDYALFSRARDEETVIPEDMLRIQAPIIGCVATQTPFMDLVLLTEVFKRRPEWSFVFIGVERTPDDQAGEKLRHFQSLPNVHFIGRRSLLAMPGYLKHCDVCAVPWLPHDIMLASSSPLKMYEYLAAGKPVVCTSTPPLRRHFDSVITFATNANEWVAAIETALQDNDPRKVAERQRIAREHTWEKRVAFIAEKLAEEFSRHRNQP